jgi:hypothetical protein
MVCGENTRSVFLETRPLYIVIQIIALLRADEGCISKVLDLWLHSIQRTGLEPSASRRATGFVIVS